jgi:phosphoribosylglycinamide formyltransferase-1
MSDKLQLAVLGSGKGSNMQSILDAIGDGRLDARIVCVFSDVQDAVILERARKAGIPAEFVDCAPFKTKLDGDPEQQLVDKLRGYGADLVVLAGFMRMVKPGLLRAFPRRIVNIHPSLLPSFPGLEAWHQALEHGAKVTGCTVHFVDEGMDTGPILVQKAVPVRDDDTPSTLHVRIQEQEHVAYPEALQLIASGRIRVEGRRVVVER